MAITIDISTGIDGEWTLQDNGNPSDGMSELRDPNGALFITFAHPGDSVTLLSRSGQNVTVNLTESLGTTSLTIGSLTSTTVRPDLVFVNRVSTSGNVTLTALQTITEATGDAAADIIANQLLIDAGQTIGTGGNPIETQVAQLEAEAISGGIFLSNIGDLTVGGVTAELRGLFTGTSGNISLTNQGTISLFDSTNSQTIASAGNITLTAIGAAANIVSTVNNDALFATGDITLSAGQDILFGTIGVNWDNDVRAGGGIFVTAGDDFHIDGNSDMLANDAGTGSNGGIQILVGGDILIEDDTGTSASVAVTTGTGGLLLATGAGGTLSLGANSAAAVAAGSGGVVVAADRVLIESDSGITATGGGSITINGASASRNIILGSVTDAAAAVELSDAELDRLFAQNVIIGSALAGQVAVQGAITHPNANLTLQSESDVLIQADISAPTSLTLRGGDTVTQDAATTITTGALNVFVDTPDLDAPGGQSAFAGTVTVTSSTITGNNDADTLGGTTGNDTVWAGDSVDLMVLNQGGDDTAMGEGGNDRIYFGAAMTGADIAIGGDGADSVILLGNYSGGLTLGASSLQGIEIIRLLSGGGGFDYRITMNDGNVDAGKFLTINATDLVAGESLTFIGMAETNGRFVVNSGDGNDILVGGARNDQLNGGTGIDTLYGLPGDDILFAGDAADFLTGGFGRDTMLYTAATESSSLVYDTLDRFEPSRDWIDLPTAVTGWSGGVTGGNLDTATFDSDLAAAINGILQPNSAAFFVPGSGFFARRYFAVVDGDGDGNYTAGADYVFEFVDPVQAPEMTGAYFI